MFIVEASYPRDFYRESLDGRFVENLLNTMRVENKGRIVLTPRYFRTAVTEAITGGYDILHVSCHGDRHGIDVASVEHPLSWNEFADFFHGIGRDLPALVMSSCCGAASGISRAFEQCRHRPPFIFGSTEKLGYSEYCAAWALLYHRFKKDRFSRSRTARALDTAMTAMEQISAVVNYSFLYRRWDEEEQRYLRYPHSDASYSVVKDARLTRGRQCFEGI